MSISDEISVPKLGTGFDALEKELATGVGVDSLVEEGVLDEADQGCDVGGAAEHDAQDVAGDGGEQDGPTLDGNALAKGAELLAQGREQVATDDEGDEDRVDQRLDDDALARGHVLGAIAALELAEHQFNGPSGSIGLCDVLGGELLGRDV